MVVKLIRCPSCGEEIELRDIFEGMEIQCNLCNSVMLFHEGKILLLDTNEEFELEELLEEELEEDVFEEDYYFDEEEYY
jgi:DNA-directed RNA polymerase subunit RPC12/RpoP